MPTFLPNNMSETAMVLSSVTRKEPLHSPDKARSARNILTKNMQKRHKSMPGPSGTADSEIGRLALRYPRVAFSSTGRSPAHNSYKMRSSTNEIPPTPNLSACTDQCSASRKAATLTNMLAEKGQAATSAASIAFGRTPTHAEPQI